MAQNNGIFPLFVFRYLDLGLYNKFYFLENLNINFRTFTSIVCLESTLKLTTWQKASLLKVPTSQLFFTEHFDQRKTKRVRTSFKHYQIQLMKQAFAEKPNPDSNDLKKLSNQTGLAKRVLQVELSSKLRYTVHCSEYFK